VEFVAAGLIVFIWLSVAYVGVPQQSRKHVSKRFGVIGSRHGS
jgi:hypothetical protein